MWVFCHIAAGVEYYVRVLENDADAVAEALATKGPLAVAVDASPFFMYTEGIFDGCRFDKDIDINHLVQLVTCLCTGAVLRAVT